MVMIPAGTFLMGSPEEELGRSDNEGPQHRVTIKSSFALGRYPVTFEEFDHFCEETGHDKPHDAGWGRDLHPAINVTWRDAKAYCDWLTSTAGFTYCLPSEAWWEYACRAGTASRFSFGSDLSSNQANFIGELGRTVAVGSYPANAFGLFDMHGNVWEWCEDRYRASYKDAPNDGTPVLSGDGTGLVLRGGSWDDYGARLRSACRFELAPDFRFNSLGFRCARIQE